MSEDNKDLSPHEAQQALESIGEMERAGWRRGVPDRWFGVGIAILIASLFALYALEDPYQYIPFPIIGLALFIIAAREKSGAYGRDFPNKAPNIWALVLSCVVLLTIFFGSIIIRRAYDLAWVPLAAGLLVGLLVFLASESERRAYLKKSQSA